MFAGKHGLITPRDLFKWANRGAVTYEELAENGFMILGERLRSQEERSVVKNTLQSNLNVKVSIFIIGSPTFGVSGLGHHAYSCSFPFASISCRNKTAFDVWQPWRNSSCL